MSDEGDTGGGPGEGGYGLDLFQFDSNNCPNWWGGEWNLGMYEGIARANLLLSKLDRSHHDRCRTYTPQG